jgi:CheY-like chemotaxis protein
MVEYRLYFFDEWRMIKARQGFLADNDNEAREFAALIFHACHDKCSSYELWSGVRLMLENSSESIPSSHFALLTDRVQERVVEYELRLRDSHWIVGKSQGLLEGLEAANKIRARRISAKTVDRVLIVDDNKTAREWMVRIVRDDGFDVAEAEDFKPALAIVRDGNPLRLLIADVKLPTSNGRALGRLARMAHNDIKAIYVTAYDPPKRQGMIGPVLCKPFPADELLVTVRRLVGGSGGSASASS